MADKEGVAESKPTEAEVAVPAPAEVDRDFGLAAPAPAPAPVAEVVVVEPATARTEEIKVVIRPPPAPRRLPKAVSRPAGGPVFEAVAAAGLFHEAFDEIDVGAPSSNLRISRGAESVFTALPDGEYAGSAVVEGPAHKRHGSEEHVKEQLLVVANRGASSLLVVLLNQESAEGLPTPVVHWSIGGALGETTAEGATAVPVEFGYKFNAPSHVAANPRFEGAVLVADRNPWVQQVSVTGTGPAHFIGFGHIDGPVGGLAANGEFIVAGKATFAATPTAGGQVYVFGNKEGFPFLRRILPYGADPTQLRVPEVIKFTRSGTIVIGDAAPPAGRPGLFEYNLAGKPVRTIEFVEGRQPDRDLRHDFLLLGDEVEATPLPSGPISDLAEASSTYATSLAASADGTVFTVFNKGNPKAFHGKGPHAATKPILELESIATPLGAGLLAGSIIALCLSLRISHMSTDSVDHKTLAVLRYVALGLIFFRLLEYINVGQFLLYNLALASRLHFAVKVLSLLLGSFVHIASITLQCIAIGMVEHHEKANAYWYTVASLIFQLLALLFTTLDYVPLVLKKRLYNKYACVHTYVRNEFDVRAVTKALIAQELHGRLNRTPTQDQIDAEYEAYVAHRAAAHDVVVQPAGTPAAPTGLFAALRSFLSGSSAAAPAPNSTTVKGTASDVFGEWSGYFGRTYSAVSKAEYKQYRNFVSTGVIKSRLRPLLSVMIFVPPVIMAIIDASAANRLFNESKDPFMDAMVGAFMLLHFGILGALVFRFYYHAELSCHKVFDFTVYIIAVGGLISTMSTGHDNLSLVSGTFFSCFTPTALLLFRVASARPDLFSKLVCLRAKAPKFHATKRVIASAAAPAPAPAAAAGAGAA